MLKQWKKSEVVKSERAKGLEVRLRQRHITSLRSGCAGGFFGPSIWYGREPV